MHNADDRLVATGRFPEFWLAGDLNSPNMVDKEDTAGQMGEVRWGRKGTEERAGGSSASHTNSTTKSGQWNLN